MALSIVKTKSQKLSDEKSSNQPLSNILYQLMSQNRIKQIDLSKQTGIPTSTLNKIFLGTTDDPRASTLRTLAQFFGVTIDQLLGIEKLSDSSKPEHKDGVLNLSNELAAAPGSFLTPVLEWSQVTQWLSLAHAKALKMTDSEKNGFSNLISVDAIFSQKTFALKVKQSMSGYFRLDSLIIIDPKAEFKDGSFVLVSTGQTEPTVRLISKDGADTYLKPLETFLTPILLESHHRIIGTIVETRYTFNA